MARAISSLPTPDSPSMRIGMLDDAARKPSEITRCMASSRMMRSENVSVPSWRFLMRVISPDSASIFKAERIETSSRSGAGGLDDEIDSTSTHCVDGGINRPVCRLDNNRR
jgi:hypothetical protein